MHTQSLFTTSPRAGLFYGHPYLLTKPVDEFCCLCGNSIDLLEITHFILGTSWFAQLQPFEENNHKDLKKNLLVNTTRLHLSDRSSVRPSALPSTTVQRNIQAYIHQHKGMHINKHTDNHKDMYTNRHTCNHVHNNIGKHRHT